MYGKIPKILGFFFAIFSKYWWFHTTIHKLLEFIKLYKQNPLEIFFLTIYQNYTLALTSLISFRQFRETDV